MAGRSDVTRTTEYGGNSAGEWGRRCDRDTRGGRGKEQRHAWVRPNPGGLTSPGVYGYWVHGNLGTHLDGGIAENSAWQAWWRDLAVMPSWRYDAPSGKVGGRFVKMIGAEMQGVRDRRWNSEWLIVFQAVILQRARHVTASNAIRRCI